MKKVSVSTWKKLLPKEETAKKEAVVHFKDSDETMTIFVTPELEIKDRMSLAKGVVDACFDEKDGTYIPYAFDISLAIYLIQYFTNVDVGKDTKLIYQLARRSDIISVIKNTVGDKTMDQIEIEIYELLQWQKSKHLRGTKTEELYDALSTLLNMLSEFGTAAMEKAEDAPSIGFADYLRLLDTEKKN